MYETESVITMVLGCGWSMWSARPSPAELPVGARNLFRQCFAVYLPVHHPLTLLYGAWITPVIKSNTLGFIGGLVFVGIALILYEIHLRIPLLRFCSPENR